MTQVVYLTPAEARLLETYEKRYRKAARLRMEERTAFFHKITGGNYTSITIRDQKTRWGSCSSSGTLSFNYRLIFAPPAILDYVVVHELAHRVHPDHSSAFHAYVESMLPGAGQLRKEMKTLSGYLTLLRELNEKE